jgi:cation transport regulator ChaC
MTTHQRLRSKWSAAEFGVKTRVFQEHLQQKIEYILKTETYSKEEVMLEIMASIEKHSKEVVKEAKYMDSKIQGS